MAKKPTLLETAKALPDAAWNGSLGERLTAAGMREEFDELLAAWISGKLASKFSSKRKLYFFLKERVPFKFGITSLTSYIEVKHGKKVN
jgi:hypothetical protein